MVGRGNSLLEECGLDSITIQNDKTQFIKLAFLIARNQDILLHQHFANDPHSITRLVGELFDETTPRAGRLDAYIRKGGDRVIKSTDECSAKVCDPLQEMLRAFPEFAEDQSGPTIFNHPEEFHRVENMLY